LPGNRQSFFSEIIFGGTTSHRARTPDKEIFFLVREQNKTSAALSARKFVKYFTN
jgi:hypothetical protein